MDRIKIPCHGVWEVYITENTYDGAFDCFRYQTLVRHEMKRGGSQLIDGKLIKLSVIGVAEHPCRTFQSDDFATESERSMSCWMDVCRRKWRLSDAFKMHNRGDDLKNIITGSEWSGTSVLSSSPRVIVLSACFHSDC